MVAHAHHFQGTRQYIVHRREYELVCRTEHRGVARRQPLPDGVIRGRRIDVRPCRIVPRGGIGGVLVPVRVMVKRGEFNVFGVAPFVVNNAVV